MQIEKINNSHLDSIIAIHFNVLQQGILILFGKEFLRRMYSELIKLNWGFICIDNGKIVGYILSTKYKISLSKLLSIKSIFIFILNIIFDLNKLRSFIIAFIYTCFFPGLIATMIWVNLVKRIGVIVASSFHFLTPPTGVVIAYIILNEKININKVS